MSVTAFVPLSRLFIQFKCLNAPDQTDKYCHDHSDQIRRWKQMIWPCRELQLEGNDGQLITNETVSQLYYFNYKEFYCKYY